MQQRPLTIALHRGDPQMLGMPELVEHRSGGEAEPAEPPLLVEGPEEGAEDGALLDRLSRAAILASMASCRWANSTVCCSTVAVLSSSEASVPHTVSSRGFVSVREELVAKRMSLRVGSGGCESGSSSSACRPSRERVLESCRPPVWGRGPGVCIGYRGGLARLLGWAVGPGVCANNRVGHTGVAPWSASVGCEVSGGCCASWVSGIGMSWNAASTRTSSAIQCAGKSGGWPILPGVQDGGTDDEPAGGATGLCAGGACLTLPWGGAVVPGALGAGSGCVGPGLAPICAEARPRVVGLAVERPAAVLWP